jgi:hypothetical protein
MSVLWAFPNGYPSWRLAISHALGHVAVEQGIALRPTYEAMGGREGRAMDWYLKAVNTPYDVDQFMFLWIALEVLLDSDAGALVEASYKARCGHMIATCPECGKPTTVPVRGESVRAYLVRYGVSPEDARALWQTRMMMHGRTGLTREALTDLGGQVQALRRAVVPALKARLQVPDNEAPIVSGGDVPAFMPHFGFGGRAAVAERHLSGC